MSPVLQRRKAKTQADHIEAIKKWQAETGLHGAPPKQYDVGLSNYIQWCRKHNDSPAAIAFELAVAPLGISFAKGVTSAANVGKVDHSRPRGLFYCLDEAQKYIDAGRYPSLLSASKDERHLAGWCVRSQTGLISGRHVSSDPASPPALRLLEFVASLAKVQSGNQFAVEWHVFTLRLRAHLRVATKGDGWCEQMCQRDNAVVFAESKDATAQIERLRAGSKERPSLPSPASVIRAINERLGSMARPVSFPIPRSTTVDATSRLLGVSITLYETFPMETV